MPVPRNMAFSAYGKLAAVLGLVLALILVGQPFSQVLYRFGFVLLIIASLVQIAFGNMKDGATCLGGLAAIGIVVLLTGILVAIGIFLAPYLVTLGR